MNKYTFGSVVVYADTLKWALKNYKDVSMRS